MKTPIRLSALTALSALAACTTAATTDAIDGDSLIAAASLYTPTYDDGVSRSGDVAETDAADGGLVGFMGYSDGKVRPVRVRFSEDDSTIFLSVDGGEERALPVSYSSSSSRYSSSDGEYLEAYTYHRAMNYITYGEYGSEEEEEEYGLYGRGYFGLQIAPGDLPTGTAEYSGYVYIYGDRASLDANIDAEVDFDDSSISGNLDGYFYDYGSREEESADGSVSGELNGEVAGSFVAMSSDVSGEGIEGNIGFLGAFYDYEYSEGGNVIAGGVAGTINDNDVGGEFMLYEGSEFEDR